MLVGRLGAHLGPGRAQKRFDEVLSAARAVRRRFAQTLSEMRLRLDQRRHQLAQRTQIAALFRHQRT